MTLYDLLWHTVHHKLEQCLKTDFRFCIADESDPTHQWYVELDQCSLDNSVRVIYSDYSGEDGSVLGELKFQEIRLECTEPEGVAQVSMLL